MYPRIKFQSKKEFDAYMWRATYGFTGRQFEAGLMNLHVRSEWHDALRSYIDVWEEESELDAQRIRWWNQYSCTVVVGPEWFLDYATKKGVVKRLREESWGVPHICPDMHSGQIPHPRGERLLDTLKAYAECLETGKARSVTIGCPKKDVEFVQRELLHMIPFGKRGRIWVQPCGAFDWKHLLLVVVPK